MQELAERVVVVTGGASYSTKSSSSTRTICDDCSVSTWIATNETEFTPC